MIFKNTKRILYLFIYLLLQYSTVIIRSFYYGRRHSFRSIILFLQNLALSYHSLVSLSLSLCHSSAFTVVVTLPFNSIQFVVIRSVLLILSQNLALSKLSFATLSLSLSTASLLLYFILISFCIYCSIAIRS